MMRCPDARAFRCNARRERIDSAFNWSSDVKRVAAGVDVGGTFTDLAAIAEDGEIRTTKVLSIPADRASGVLAAIDASGISGSAFAFIAHGTTVVTNLLLERAGARVVACVTSGFTDLLELRRQERASLYDLTRHHPDRVSTLRSRAPHGQAL